MAAFRWCSHHFLSFFLLLYFLASTADLLHLEIAFFKVKLALITPLFLLPFIRLWHIPKPLLHAFLLILLSQTLSAIFGTAPIRSFGYIAVYCLNFIFYFLIPYTLLRHIDLRLFFRAYWGAFSLIGLYAAAQVICSLFNIYLPFSLQRAAHIARGQAWLYEPSYYALYMTAYTMFHNTLSFLRRTPLLKLISQNLLLVLSTSTGLIVIYPLFFILSFLGALIPNPYRPLIRKKLKFALLAFCLTLLTISLCFPEIALVTLFKFFNSGLGHGSFSDRWGQGVNSLHIFLSHPFLGVGLGGVGPLIFATTSAYDTTVASLSELDSFDPNLCFAELLGSLGLVGVFAMLNLCVLFYRTFTSLMKSPSISDENKQIATALFFSLVISIFVLQMNQNLFRPYIWIHAAIVFGYFNRIKEEQPVENPTSQETQHASGVDGTA